MDANWLCNSKAKESISIHLKLVYVLRDDFIRVGISQQNHYMLKPYLQPIETLIAPLLAQITLASSVVVLAAWLCM